MAFVTREGERKRSRFFFCCVKNAFARCPRLGGRHSEFDSDEEDSFNDSEDDREMVLLTIRARAMEEKSKRKGQFESILSSTAGELFVSAKGKQPLESDIELDDGDEFFSAAGSCLSRCSSSSREAFLSVGSCLSRSSSTSKIELREFPRRNIFQEFKHCEGWPFGLSRKVVFPPLPKCPTDSWSWNKHNKMMKKP